MKKNFVPSKSPH